MKKWFRAFLVVSGLLILALFLAERAPKAFPQSDKTYQVSLISNGWHMGFGLSQQDIAEFSPQYLKLIADNYPDFPFLEIGWGEAVFYQSHDTTEWQLKLALKALFQNNPSVLHVVGLPIRPEKLFDKNSVKTIVLSKSAFQELLNHLENSIKSPDKINTGLYGTSHFYAANGTFNLFNVCNHWVAIGLNKAGLRVNMLLATLPKGLFIQ